MSSDNKAWDLGGGGIHCNGCDGNRCEGIEANCQHDFIFLRQETKNIGYDRNPTWIVEDVFFCSSCLEYKRVAVEKRTPTVTGGEHVEKLK